MSRLKKHQLFSRCYKLDDYFDLENRDVTFDYEFSADFNEFIKDCYDDEGLVMNKTQYCQTISDGVVMISVWVDFVQSRDSTDVESICESIQRYAG